MENNVLNDFSKIRETYYPPGHPKQGSFQLICGDSIDIMKTYEPNSLTYLHHRLTEIMTVHMASFLYCSCFGLTAMIFNMIQVVDYFSKID